MPLWGRIAANAIVTFAEVIRLNYQLSSKVGDVLGKLFGTRLYGDGSDVARIYRWR